MVNFVIMDKFRHTYSYDYTRESYEFSELPSETVPDGFMSVRDILTRHDNGIISSSRFTPVYDSHDFGGGQYGPLGFDDDDPTDRPDFDFCDAHALEVAIAKRKVSNYNRDARNQAFTEQSLFDSEVPISQADSESEAEANA